jgi:glycosyltransferase involved in cell wall biosynthesis
MSQSTTNDVPLRVLLASASSGSKGGGELYLVGLAEGLTSLGHHVEALLADHPRMDGLAELLQPWATVHRHPYINTYDRRLRLLGALLDRSLIRRFRDHFDRIHPDVIHINKQNLEDGLDLVTAAARSGLPCVTTIHVTRDPADLGAWAGRFRGRTAQRVLRYCGIPCLAIAHSCAKQLAAQFADAGASPHIHMVFNGVSDAPPSSRKAIRQAWGCRDTDVVLGCLARIEQQKNPLFLVELLPDLPEQVRLVWIGDGRLRDTLLARAQQIGVRHRVLVDGWRNDGRARLAGLDVFALPSQYEGFPLALLEAMAAALPCIASDVDGTREAIVHDESGFLCPSADRDAWLVSLRTLIESESCRKKMAWCARKRYLECFSLETMARGTAAVYHQVIEEMPKWKTATISMGG